MRASLGLLLHWVGSAFLAAVALQWVSVSSGRAGVSTLLVPEGVTELANAPAGSWGLFGPVVVVAGFAGAVLAPLMWLALSRLAQPSSWPRATAAVLGMAYACCTLVVTVAAVLPIVSVAGRAPGRSGGSALVEGLALSLVGTPLVATAMALIVSPVLIVGGSGVGLLAHAVVRSWGDRSAHPRRLNTNSS